MDNYTRALLYARELFLQWDQERMIRRCRLRSDGQYLYLNFLSRPYRIERSSGVVECIAGNPVEAGFSESLSIYDYLCRQEALPFLSGRYCPPNSLRSAARSSPSNTSLHQPCAERLQAHIPALKEALNGFSPFPHGDAACLFPVFDGFNAVFQFWEGDEEFPPSIHFLWDENTPDLLKYETLYYIMGTFLQLLEDRICEIEKNL